MIKATTNSIGDGRPSVRVLIIEHNPLDIELIQKTMAAEFPVDCKVVQDLAGVGTALKEPGWDVILSDHNLPGWSGMEALALVRREGLQIPFILVTGTLGEEQAAECFRQGVTDYVLKHRLEMLPVALARALKEAALRREKQAAEATLHLQATALEAADNAILITDAGGNIQWVNPAFERLTGYSSDEVKGQNPRILRSGQHDTDFYKEMWETIVVGRVWEGELTNRRKDGSLYTELQTITPVRDAHGVIANFIGVKEDITDRKQAEQALQASEAAYRGIIEGAPYGIYRVRADGQILMANPALATMLGYDSAAELVGRNTATDVYLRAEDRERCLAQWRDRGTLTYEATWKRKDGGEILVRLAGRTWQGKGEAEPSYEVFVEDVTERRSLEGQLRQAQKMEAVGRLAGGVAHDFNNLLGVIVGYSDLVLEAVTDERSRKRLIEIKKAAGRAVELTRQLLAFSRKQVLEPRIIDLNHLVTEVGQMLLRLLGEDIELVLNLSPVLGAVKADPNQMEQVIMNLAVNARDAMPHGGRLTIETANVTLDENYGRQKRVEFTAGDYVMLAVTDTGTGMDDGTKARLFEPFFTTKELGKGTGLGLATVYGIVKQSGGYVWVYSELGRGTAFKVYLPRIGGVAAEAGASLAAMNPLSGSETILLVEDSQSLNALNCEMLTSLGYHVLSAANGAEALQIAKEHKAAIHLLLTDVIMPGMNGRELAERLLQMRSDLKVMYMSGYTDDVIVHHEILKPGVAFLQKPFSKDELSNRVHEVLRKRS